MKYLIELVALLNKNKLKSNGLWNVLLEPASKMEALYELVHDNRVQTDEEAAALLYEHQEELYRYGSLKNKLKDRLIEGLFLLDFKEPAFSDRQRAYYECNKKWAAAQILMTRNARLNGIEQLEKLLRLTTRFEFTELSLNVLRMLRLHYGTVEGDQKKYDQINEQFQELQTLWLRENRVEELYTELTVKYVTSKSAKQDISTLSKQYYDEIAPWLGESDAFKLHLMGRLLQVTIFSSVNDYHQTAALCEEAIRFFEQKPYDSGLPLQVFYYQLVVCYIQLKEFDKGQAMVDKFHHLFEEGSFNWFKLQELYYLLAMHTAQYSEAALVCHKVLRHAKLPAQPGHVAEMWKIYEAFIQFLYKIEKIPQPPKPVKFRMHKFLNEIPVFSKDKRGMNIPILILQILFLISERNYDLSIDRIDAIEKYCSRYLKRNETFRSNVFIKMLIHIPLASFHAEAVKRKTDKLFELLKENPLEIANQPHEIEIIPYEELWDMLLQRLDLKIHSSSFPRASRTG